MAMKNNLNSTHKASNYKQVKRPNGKYGHMSLQSGINKCDICGKNFPKKLFDHIRKFHYQYFCIVCRARFKVHKDLICHVKDVHQLLASENLNKAQDEFSNKMNKRYFAEPPAVSQLPISPLTISQLSNSSSDDEELLLDNPDVINIIIGTKNSKQHKEETEITNIVNDIVIEVLEDFKAKELFESTLQDLSCSDGSVTDESDYKTVNKLRSSENDTYSHYSKTQNNCDNFLSSNVYDSEINEINDKMCTSHKYPSNENLQPSQTVHIVDKEFKLGIKNMTTVLSEKSPWLNGPDTMQNINNSAKSENDLLVMALTLDHKLVDMKLNIILKECIRTSCLTCVYCHNSTCIAVNGKQLALHMIEKHRFMTVKNESSEDVANILKSNLNILENVYLNSENFDSTDELSHTSFNNTFYCFNCQYTSTQMKEVNSHKRSIHSRKTYECLMCKITFSNYSELHCHLCPGTELGVWQNVLFRCLFCGQSQIPSAFRCMVHLRKAHNACDYCLETFPNQQSLAIHVNKHKMRHICLKCNITYLNKKDIFEHMFWKHNRDSKECKLCLTKKWPYTYHFCVPPTIFACDECKRTFSNALLLRVHERWHTGNIPYECSTCHSKFISKKLLKKHEIIHNELISSTKKKKKKKKKKGDDYNLPPLNLSSDSDTEKTPRNKPEKYLKSPSPSGNNYWDYVSKQKKELVNIALLDHDYTLLSTIQPAIKSPQYPDELTTNVNGSENLLNNSFNNSLCQRSSCSSHCNSSSSLSSSCGSNCSCSSSCSSSSDSDTGEKIKTIVESPKKHKKKKKEKKIKVPSAKKIKNFNLYALESDLESEFSNTDNEEYYDINPVPLHPEVNMVSKDILPVKQENLIENKPVSVNMNSTLMPQISPMGQNYKLSKPLNNPYQYTNIESQLLGNNVIGLSHNECKIPEEYEMYRNNYSSTNSLSYNEESIDNNLNKNSIEICNGNNNLHSVQNDLNLSKYHSQRVDKRHYSKKHFNSSFTKRPTKRKSKFKTSKNISQLPKEITYTSSPLSMNSSYLTSTSDLSKTSMSPNDTRQSKRQPKKRKFFGYESSDEEQIPNGDSSFIHQFPPHLPSSIKKHQKRKHKPESPIQFQPKTSKLTQSQQTRPIVDVRISKTAVPTIDDETDSDSDSGNLVIELPKFVEQKAVQSTERLYCHCRCPYDEVSEMIACDNPNCRVEWFHFDCVGITIAPKGNWYCPDCR
ncbi:Zinc finger, PHD-type,Zinc finger, FYVE/PHD-type,Zinc finger, RING/FYVE/PHD-type,Zinc finger, PHD- [Cinara cedri]|uniref:Zinc finger, PHD-type,Zinc finger, FYVE/PHD-type,Zinc finger, RING/FYVE/PHD-type,Zinc finger, PHD n=1 Tax=Cinara cedri TaxID=506608 RepID=A0A5E4M806_9HEMI|nr:Zinc finger, PHD-type,Zinc finger, FYVE/PHD-type,Zinc finger, RING/FYVE/PHD-type,Zinc finger, PHD- [Cinara cedri]